jgi:1,4-alpha-glucan branching enzyme
VTAVRDEERSIPAICDALTFRYNGDAFRRVIYSESHDEVANGRARVPHEIDPDHSKSWAALKRSTLAAGLVFTAPGIPMVFQGQEFLEGEWFRDTVPVDWHKNEEFQGIVRLYRDLIHLRLNRTGVTDGLTGQGMEILHAHDADKVVAFHRFDQASPEDGVVVVANFSHLPKSDYGIRFPQAGDWYVQLNSDWNGYHESFANHPAGDVHVTDADGAAMGTISIGAYSLLIFSRRSAKA